MNEPEGSSRNNVPVAAESLWNWRSSAVRGCAVAWLLMVAVLLSGEPIRAQGGGSSDSGSGERGQRFEGKTDVEQVAAVLLDMAQRQRALEWKLYLALAVAGLALAVAMGLLWLRWRGSVAGRSWTLLDKRGRVRAQLQTGEGGEVELEFRDADGVVRATFGVVDEGDPGLRLRDREGKERASLKVGLDGAPYLEFYDARESLRGGLGMTEDGGVGWGCTTIEGGPAPAWGWTKRVLAG